MVNDEDGVRGEDASVFTTEKQMSSTGNCCL